MGNMKGAKGRNPSRSPSPSLTQVLQVQELRSYIEREKGKPQSEARFKDSQGLRQARPSSATSAVSASGKTGAASSLSRFLTELGLSRYLSQFLQSGVEDLETALELTEADLERMGIALGHRIKILKRLRDLCGPREEAKTVAPAKHPEKPPLPPASTPSQPKASPKPAVKDGNDEQSGYEALMSVNERVGYWEGKDWNWLRSKGQVTSCTAVYSLSAHSKQRACTALMQGSFQSCPSSFNSISVSLIVRL